MVNIYTLWIHWFFLFFLQQFLLKLSVKDVFSRHCFSGSLQKSRQFDGQVWRGYVMWPDLNMNTFNCQIFICKIRTLHPLCRIGPFGILQTRDPSTCAARCWKCSTNLLLPCILFFTMWSAGGAASQPATPTDLINQLRRLGLLKLWWEEDTEQTGIHHG